jgi:hypothetical protein
MSVGGPVAGIAKLARPGNANDVDSINSSLQTQHEAQVNVLVREESRSHESGRASNRARSPSGG